MKLERNDLANLGEQIDLMNTIQGGVTMTNMELDMNESGYVASFRNPAYDSDNYHIELNEDRLTVYATLSGDYVQQREGKKVVIPTFVQHFPIPANVDVQKIEAVFEEGALNVYAPFKSGMNDLPKRIDIRNL